MSRISNSGRGFENRGGRHETCKNSKYAIQFSTDLWTHLGAEVVTGRIDLLLLPSVRGFDFFLVVVFSSPVHSLRLRLLFLV